MKLTADRILALVDHGFELTDIISDHNYSIVLDLLERDSARITLLKSPVLKRKLRRYSQMGTSARNFIQHLLRDILAYCKPKADRTQLRYSIGKPNTMAYCINEDTGRISAYTSLYDDGQWEHPLRAGLLMEWDNWKLVSIHYVALTKKATKTNVLATNSPITKTIIYNNIRIVNADIYTHVDKDIFQQQIRGMILNELCSQSAWTPAMTFLKHLTDDYSGIDHILVDALNQERQLVNSDLDRDDIQKLSGMIILFLTAIIESDNVRYMSEEEFFRISVDRRPKYVIIHGLGTCLYYGYRWNDGTYYYLKIDDLKRVRNFIHSTDNTTLAELSAASLGDIIPVIQAIQEESNK